MNKSYSTVMATVVFGLVAGVGLGIQPTLVLAEGKNAAGEGGAENIPSNVQRSAPAGQNFPGSGTGPGSRGDALTETEKHKSSMGHSSAAGKGKFPENVQRSAPAGQDFPGSGSGPGSRTD